MGAGSLQKKLAFILTGLAIAAVILSTWILSAFDRYHFQEYVNQNKQLRNERISQVLTQAYEKTGSWTPETGADVGEYSSREGLNIRLFDENKRLIWQYANQPPVSSHPKGVENQHNPQEHWESAETIGITSQGKTVGYVEIANVDPESYTMLDYHYWQGMTQGVFSAILPVILLSLLVSWILSRRIAQPLTDMIGLARKMREGRLDVRVQSVQTRDELSQLADSLNHLAEELQKQDKLRKNLTADVAHELRTPLTTLKSHIEALVDGVWKPTPDRLKDCQEEVERLIGLASSLESLSQAESESLVMKLQTEDLVQVTRSVLQLMEAVYSQKGVRLELQASESINHWIDKDKWKQIIINLLKNALTHTHTGGQVMIEMKKMSGESVLISVKDSGKGILPEHLPYIFERFYRADPSRTRSTGGAGIGLAIVKKLVEAHHGTIEVKSEPGKGTEFVITLPVET